MKNLSEITEECQLSYEQIREQFRPIFEEIFNQQGDWLKDVEQKTNLLSNKNRAVVETVINKLKQNSYSFTTNDTSDLSAFVATINSIIKIANRINNFKEGVTLSDGSDLKLFELFNSFKSAYSLEELALDLNQNLNNFKPHLFSVIKHCQDPSNYPICYRYWRNIFVNVLKKKSDYDSLCFFYRQFPSDNRHLNFGSYFGSIGVILARKISENRIIAKSGDANYRFIKDNYLSLDEYFNRITGFEGRETNYKDKFEAWLNQSKQPDSNMPGSYIRAIEILSEILDQNLFELDDLTELKLLYEELVMEQKKDYGKYYYQNAVSYGKSGFYSASIASYMNFLESQSVRSSIKEDKKLEAVKNVFSQAVCVVGESGVGKTFRVNRTLEDSGHKTLSVIVDNMWQHILFDYSPDDRKYYLTKVGKFIKQAVEDPLNNYTVVFDECHKNLEIINDVLLQAISTKRNGGMRFLSLNSLVDESFDFLTEKYGNRVLPDNLGFIFVSSKSDIIEGNDDLKSRIDIIELYEEDQSHKEFSMDFLLDKKRVEEKSEYSN